MIRKIITLFCLIILGCASCSDSSRTISGYIEGEYTYISSGVSGTLNHLWIQRGQTVSKGEWLYELDLQPETARVEEAQANIKNLQAQVNFARTQLDRHKKLYDKNASSKEDLDQAQSDFDSKTQQLASNRAVLIESSWALQQKKIAAPVSGVVFDTFYRIGEKVPSDHPVLAILAPENIKALFYIPEKILSHIKLGQQVTITCDGCEKKTKAMIDYISPEAEYTPPVIYSKDTRDKLVYLIRAAIPKEEAEKFHPGQPIDVHLSYE